MLQHLTGSSANISFPEMTIPCVVQLKAFVKTCKVANYSKKMRQLLAKVEENSKFITEKRRAVTFKVWRRVTMSALNNVSIQICFVDGGH